MFSSDISRKYSDEWNVNDFEHANEPTTSSNINVINSLQSQVPDTNYIKSDKQITINQLSQVMNDTTRIIMTKPKDSELQEIYETDIELDDYFNQLFKFNLNEIKIENEKYLKDIWNRFGKIDIM